MKHLKPISLAALCFVAFSSHAAPSLCPEHYPNGERPDLTNPRLELSATELCSAGHAVWFSGVARSPIWSASFLTKGRVEQARSVKRSNNFRADTRIPADWRNLLSDFKGSGFDRGHMAPSGDMHTPIANSESFLLTNIVAQDAHLNRNLWAAIEQAVRAHARYRPAYVFTGPLFLGEKIQRLQGRVLIPTHIYKLVYEPERHAAAAYVVENKPHQRHREISLEELEALSGVTFFPKEVGIKRLKLPKPRYPQ